MIKLNEVLLSIINKDFKENELVTILELLVSELDIDTISEMARKENKSPNGINISKCYRKIKIGKQKFAVKGLRDSSVLPF